jgi:PhzF family phenazine biosynthesis protein
MSKYRFIQLDVFTAEAFAGNPLAVFPEAEGLTDDEMMKIAREMNLSETVFVLKPDKEQSANSEQQTANSKQPSATAASKDQTP